MFDRLALIVQYLLPKRLLTELVGRFARARLGGLTTVAIRIFVARFRVKMDETVAPDPASYPCFNAFFARPLRPGVRGIADADLVCPVDGRISQFGAIEDGHIFQAKGHRYSATALLGGDRDLAERFRRGSFANLYLSPQDYHRIHMPCDGVLTAMTYVPGALFSVSPACARGIPGLFARNERVVCAFDTDLGTMVMVLVGATIVGSIGTAWHGIVNTPRPRAAQIWRYEDRAIRLKKGDEMGRFLMGSTVIVLVARDALAFDAAWRPAHPVQLGQVMARLV